MLYAIDAAAEFASRPKSLAIIFGRLAQTGLWNAVFD
jgi:hypothetical protein